MSWPTWLVRAFGWLATDPQVRLAWLSERALFWRRRHGVLSERAAAAGRKRRRKRLQLRAAKAEARADAIEVEIDRYAQALRRRGCL